MLTADSVDWSRGNEDIAREFHTTRQRVAQLRKRYGKPPPAPIVPPGYASTVVRVIVRDGALARLRGMTAAERGLVIERGLAKLDGDRT